METGRLIQVTELVTSEGPPPDLQTLPSFVLTCLSRVCARGRTERERERSLSSFSYKIPNPISLGSCPYDPFNQIASSKSYLQIQSHWELGHQHTNFEETQFSP